MGKKNTYWLGLAAAGLLITVLSGCGGGSDTPAPVVAPPPPVQGPPVAVPTGTSPIRLTASTPAATYAALAPKVTVGLITIQSPPVVHFSMTDADGNPIIGFGSSTKSSTSLVASYPNLSFALAKLMPGENGSPSTWVNYIVTTVPSTTSPTVAAQRPGTDNAGTLTDNGNGTYSYQFSATRDVKQVQSLIDAMTFSGNNKKADLGNLAYEPALVHRLTIQISGNVPGTGTNTANATQAKDGSGVDIVGVPMANPVDVVHDFIPATGAVVTDSGRDIVATAKCNECHRKLGGLATDLANNQESENSAAGFHGGNRNETKYCVVCHTEQRKYGRPEATISSMTFVTPTTNCTASASNPSPVCTYRVDDRAVGNLPNHIHKTHMGKHLVKQNYEYGGVHYNEVRFPQDLRNCTKCHDGSGYGTPQAAPNATREGDNWMKVPNRLACGACHDGINFAESTGVTLADAAKGKTSSNFTGFGAHGGGKQTNDSNCANCHTAENNSIYHLAVTPPSEGSFLHVANGSGSANTNAAWIASNTSRLPRDAIKVSYDIKSVAVVDISGKKRPQMVFRLLQNGARKDLNAFDTTTPSPVTGEKEIWDNFMGAPSVYFVWAVPQDGIAAPADFNASVSAYLRCLWNGTTTIPDPTMCTSGGTLTGPDGDGYYTATLTGADVPASAVMVTGGVGYSYNIRSTMPLTQTNLADYPTSASPVPEGATDQTATSTQLLPHMPNRIGGLIVIAPNAQMVATGHIGRRAIVEDKRCNACHQELGTFTEEAFHGGQRNDGTTCAWCHTPNRTSSGWSADSTSFIHAIHAGAKRTTPFTWHATGTAPLFESFAEVRYPGLLKDCETCHLPGTYDFSASASTVPSPNNRLYRTVGAGIYPANGESIPGWKLNSPPTACIAGNASVGTPLSAFSLSPYVTQSTAAAIQNYGIGFAFNAGSSTTNACKPDGTFYTIAAGSSVEADGTTLVNSPIAAVCVACHDTQAAVDHMTISGNGSFYGARTAALAKPEQCMFCHGPGKVVDIKTMHAK